MFSSFGDIEFVDLQKDSITGKNKGYGFIQYTKPEYAKEAIEKMNGFAIGNRNLKVLLLYFL